MPVQPDIQLPVGLFLDTQPEKQPQNTYRFALNAVNNAEDGAMGSLVNEPGNFKCVDLPGQIKGIIPMDRTRSAILTSDNSISIFNSDSCTLSVVVSQLDCLGLRGTITGEYRLRKGCEDVIYWRNGIDPDRFFNLSRPELFQDDEGNFDCNLFNLSFLATHPCIGTELLKSGGRTKLGNYFFSVEYLDSFENVLFKSPVTNQLVSVNDNDEDGGLNIDNSLPEVGGVELSSKSIRLSISRIPDNVTSLRLSVIRMDTGDGITTSPHVVSSLIPVGENTAEFTYVGLNESGGDTLTTVNEIVALNPIYQSSGTMAQVQGRLLRANLKETIRDQSDFQKFASKICVKYVTKDVPKLEAHLHQSEIGGEVKSYGIVYIYGDGTLSNVYSTIGTSADESQQSVINNILEVFGEGDNSQFCPDGVPYEIVYSVNGEPPITFNGSESIGDGSRTIFEGSSTDIIEVQSFSFTNPPVSSDEFIDCQFNLNYRITATQNNSDGEWRRVSTAVQDTEIEPGFSSSGTMGYYATNQVYSNPPNFCGDDFWGEDCNGLPLLGTPVRYHVIPDRAQEPLTVGDNVRIIGVKFTNIEYPHPDIVGHYFVSNIRDSFNSIVESKGIMFPYNFSDEDRDSPPYVQGRYLHNVQGATPTARSMDSGESYLHNFMSLEYLFKNDLPQGDYVVQEGSYNLNTSEEDLNVNDFFESSLPYDDLAVYKKQQDFLDYVQNPDRQIRDQNRSINLRRRSEFDDIRNLSYTSKFNIVELQGNPNNGTPVKYVSMKKDILAFPNLYSVRYRRISECPSDNVCFNGDGFISKLDLTNMSLVNLGSQGLVDVVFGEFLGIFGGDTLVRVEFEYLTDIYVESTVNPYYRHSGTELCNQYYSEGSANLFSWIIGRVTEKLDEKYKVRDSVCEEWYGYNEDYSKLSDFNEYRPNSYSFDYCSRCSGEFPNTIVYSEKSFADDQSDNYRIFLPLNTQTIPANKGPIVDMDYKDNKVVVRTSQSVYLIQPNPQQLQTNELTVFIGTGDFLSVPPQELNVVDIGWGGQQDILEKVNTDFGLVWIDRARGKVINLAGEIKELNNNGMYHWLFKNLNSNKNTCILTYDPEYKRLIITKTGSWTLSYCFATQMWKSWHSYIPSRYLFNSQTFFSEHDEALWKHNSNTVFNDFYETTYPYIVEYTMSDQISFNPDSTQYYSRAEEYVDGQWIEDKDITFDQILAYNSNQSTGLHELQFMSNSVDNLFYNPEVKHVVETDRMYKVSQLRDKATDNNIFKLDITDYQLNGHGYIDKVPSDTISLDKPQAEQGLFNGKWLNIRLFFNRNTHRLVTNIIATFKWYHNR